jgi:hypothetical protein
MLSLAVDDMWAVVGVAIDATIHELALRHARPLANQRTPAWHVEVSVINTSASHDRRKDEILLYLARASAVEIDYI